MNRVEFCNIITELRKNSNIKMVDICASVGSLPTAIYRIERGSGNFEMDKALSYLAAINVTLTLQKDERQEVIRSIEDIAKWLKNIRKGLYSQRSLAEIVGCTHKTIANVENGSNKVTVDTLLKLIDVLGYTIKIEPK